MSFNQNPQTSKVPIVTALAQQPRHLFVRSNYVCAIFDKNFGNREIVTFEGNKERRSSLFVELVQVDLFLLHDVVSYRPVANTWIARYNVQSCATSVINPIQVGSFFVEFFQEIKISLQKYKKGVRFTLIRHILTKSGKLTELIAELTRTGVMDASIW